MTKATKLFIFVMTMSLLVACSGFGRTVSRSPIVDLKGMDLGAYERDRAECEAYGDEVSMGQRVLTSTAGGAAAGAVIGAAAGNSDTAKRTAGMGAGFGALGGTRQALAERERVVRNCLLGRGYRVLN
jgi:outer membrane lipoprotein SlyB